MKLLSTLYIGLFIHFSVSGQLSTPREASVKLLNEKNTSPDANQFDLLLDSADKYSRQNRTLRAFLLLKKKENKYPAPAPGQTIQFYTRLPTLSRALKQVQKADKYAAKLHLITAHAENLATDRYVIYQTLIPYFLATNKADSAAKYISILGTLSKAKQYTAGLADNNLWLFKLDSIRGNHAAALAHYRAYAALKDSALEEFKR